MKIKNQTQFSDYLISNGLIGRFAVVKLWPGIKAAEDEFIARLKTSAMHLGLECLEITADAHLCDNPNILISQKDVDFVVHLHFETPKAYDIFSFVALWNPIQFYYDWGYRKHSSNLLTHDDFLSCDSDVADDHVIRQMNNDNAHLPPSLKMYHSLSEPILKPTLGDKKIFYVGINWERINSKKGRHHELLIELDKLGVLKLFGPYKFQGVEVWKGFKSYSGPLEFDGTSIIKEINKAGIALVFSSDAHIESNIMSMRLFESAAAGALIMADEHPFIKKHFSNSILYVKMSKNTKEVIQNINENLKWINNNPQAALDMAKASQKIFVEKFILTDSLVKIYTNFNERKQKLLEINNPIKEKTLVTLYFIFDKNELELILKHINSYKSQIYNNCRAVFVVDNFNYEIFKNKFKSTIDENCGNIDVITLKLFKRDNDGNIVEKNPMGQIISKIIALDKLPSLSDVCCFVTPNEILFSDHIFKLLGTMQKNNCLVANSNILLKHSFENKTFHDLRDTITFTNLKREITNGFSRFVFTNKIFQDGLVKVTLPYLDMLSTAWLAKHFKSVKVNIATSIIDIQSDFILTYNFNFEKELEIIKDVTDNNFNSDVNIDSYKKSAFFAEFNTTSQTEKLHIFAQLIYALPIPSFIHKFFITPYKKWAIRNKN